MSVKNNRNGLSVVLVTLSLSLFMACQKETPSVLPQDVTGSIATTTPESATYNLSYGDSIIYVLGEHSAIQIVNPVTAKTGIYSSYPKDLEIDPLTGAIDVHSSESGLRYKVFYSSTDGAIKDTTTILISGVNYMDGIYRINGADSIVSPIYNANITNTIPAIDNGTLFDEGGSCNNNGCAANASNGKINLKQTVRNNAIPLNTSKDFALNYRINDPSFKGANRIKIRIYRFNTINDISKEALDLLKDHLNTILNSPVANPFDPGISDITATPTGANAAAGATGRRRPPCLIIINE
jgi:hypothetical protein